MMKKIMIITMPIILAVSVIMVLNSANVNVFGQANQTSPQANNQSSTGGNETSASQNSTAMNEQLLNYTNNAIQAQKDKKGSALTDNLKKLQEALLKSSGKQAVIVPEPSTKDSKSSGSKSSGSSSSGSSSSDSKSKK